MIQMIPALPANVVGLVAKGEGHERGLSTGVGARSRYRTRNQRKVRLLYVMGADFEGYSGGAMWEDGKLGVEHLTRWERIAVVSDNAWIRHAVNVFGYLLPGEVKVFELEDEADASARITS